MWPELFHIGPIPIRSYGLMLALSFLLGVYYISRVTKRDGKPFESYLTISSLMIFFGVIGARLFYVLFHLDEFAGNWLSVFGSWGSQYFGIAGLNLYGGVVTALLAVLIYCRMQRLDPLEVFDYFAPTLGLGLAVTRIGCFLNGCCFGLPTSLPWGVKFPPGSIPYAIFQSQPLQPTQLYSSLYGLGLFLYLNHKMKHKQFTGQLVAILLMVEAIFRFLIEDIRYYEDAMVFKLGGVTVTYNQVISVLLFAAGLTLYLYQRARAPKPVIL